MTHNIPTSFDFISTPPSSMCSLYQTSFRNKRSKPNMGRHFLKFILVPDKSQPIPTPDQGTGEDHTPKARNGQFVQWFTVEQELDHG
mmetsp:Transcript_12090/g.17619  ORF Transcript_12090/g.17619 Transcript_12090/m.17619 type:complete len:87 (+) Transcript_12090:616-876(+)